MDSSDPIWLNSTPPTSPIFEEFGDEFSKAVVPGERFGWGWCYLECFDKQLEAAKELGSLPRVGRFLASRADWDDEDDEFGDWAMCLPGREQVNSAIVNTNVTVEEWK